MDGGQGGAGFSCPPKEDFIGDRRSAATDCFTSSELRFLAKIHDCPLQECGQATGTVCVCVCLSLHVCVYMLLDVFVKRPAHEQTEVCAYGVCRYTRVCVCSRLDRYF